MSLERPKPLLLRISKMFSPCPSSWSQSIHINQTHAQLLHFSHVENSKLYSANDRHGPVDRYHCYKIVQPKCLMWNAWLINCMRALSYRFSSASLFLTRRTKKIYNWIQFGLILVGRDARNWKKKNGNANWTRCGIESNAQKTRTDWLWRYIVNYRLCKRSQMFFANANPY